jgi:hypothetical protein
LVVEQPLERRQLLFELGCDQHCHVLVAILRRNVPLDPGKHDQLRPRGSRILDRVEVLECRRLEAEIGVISDGHRVASIDRRPVQDVVDGSRPVGKRRVCVGVDFQPDAIAGPRHLSDEPRRIARLTARHACQRDGKAEDREGADNTTRGHSISHRGTTIFRA